MVKGFSPICVALRCGFRDYPPLQLSPTSLFLGCIVMVNKRSHKQSLVHVFVAEENVLCYRLVLLVALRVAESVQ